jgi:hypothetical protein
MSQTAMRALGSRRGAAAGPLYGRRGAVTDQLMVRAAALPGFLRGPPYDRITTIILSYLMGSLRLQEQEAGRGVQASICSLALTAGQHLGQPGRARRTHLGRLEAAAVAVRRRHLKPAPTPACRPPAASEPPWLPGWPAWLLLPACSYQPYLPAHPTRPTHRPLHQGHGAARRHR